MKLSFLGGAMEIGGSCIYLRIADKGILLDSGIRQTGSKDPLPDFRTIQEQGGLDAIIISHAHMDHIGTLPIISKAYPNVRIYMTAMTADLTRVLLYDSLKIMNGREDELPYYSEPDVQAMLARIYPIGYQMPFPILERFTLSFFPAGHIAGAACVYLVTEEGSLFYSGDFSAFPQRTIDGIRIPRLRPDIVIAETTYGNRLHANRQAEEKRLVDLVRECVLQKKKVLIPAFALGRAQEVLLILRAAIQNQEIPSVPVYVDGMIRAINAMYTRNPTYLKSALGKRVLKGNEPFYTEEIQPVTASQRREELLSGHEPIIFISSSGMLTGGPSAQYAKLLAPQENACIIITGYQDEESPGRQLLNLLEPENSDGNRARPSQEAALNVCGATVPVKCRIEQVGLSAHGDKSEITALLESLSPHHIFLVHGSQDSVHELGNELASGDYRRQVYLPESGQSFELELHSKRKQQLFLPAHSLHMARAFTRADEKLLWDFWREHYPDKTFSLSQIAYIWFGKTPSEFAADAASLITEQAARLMDEINRERSRPKEDGAEKGKHDVVLQSMQRILLNSCYFAPNARRLFLIEANSPETVAEALTPKELTQQKLLDKVESIFSEYPYRKISYHNERREIQLQFDYPDRLDSDDFHKKATDFTNTTGWTIHISPSMNHSAASLLLSMLFGERLSKTSYYTEKKYYSITLAEGESPLTEKEAAEQFRSVTGWGLSINGQSHSDALTPAAGEQKSSEDFFTPAQAVTAPMEQNIAFSHIEQTFSGLPHKPDKKSLKQDSQGKYMEIGFISPMIGRRYAETLQDISNRTGWRLHIADKISQNELIRISQLLCMKYEIGLLKNPSYLPAKKLIQLKPKDSVSAEIQEKIAAKFQEMTGCSCVFTD